MKKHTLIALGLAALLAISQVNVSLAYTETIYPYFAGTSHAVGTQNAYIVSSTAWNANIQSFTIAYFGASPGSGQAIGTIGWTWWTFREVCNGVIVDNWPQPGRAYYGSSYIGDTGFEDRDSCSGSHQGESLGTHDFKDGSRTWRPYQSTSVAL